MSMNTEDDYSKLKPGDTVIIERHLQSSRLGRVEKITPTGRIVVGDTVYNKDGWPRGHSGWGAPYLRIATPERLAKVRLETNREKLRHTDWSKLPEDIVNQIADLVRAIP